MQTLCLQSHALENRKKNWELGRRQKRTFCTIDDSSSALMKFGM
jgi:hypothetical protein